MRSVRLSCVFKALAAEEKRRVDMALGCVKQMLLATMVQNRKLAIFDDVNMPG
jgi:hypothetical protein